MCVCVGEREPYRRRHTSAQRHFGSVSSICVAVRDRASERQQETILKSISVYERHSGVAAKILRVASTSDSVTHVCVSKVMCVLQKSLVPATRKISCMCQNGGPF